MPRLLESARRLLVGRPFDTARLRRRPLGRGTALPVYSANAFSSTAYAPDEILMTLALGGVALLALGPQIGLAVVAVMLLIVLSYRVSVCAYPRGGDYQIASSNLGPRAGVTVAAAMMLDLVFTVAVSVAALAQYLPISPVQRGLLGDDGQAQARAGLVHRRAGQADELAEDRLTVRLGDAAPGVADQNPHPFAVASGAD